MTIINKLYEKYKIELDDYKYIESVEEFSVLLLKGQIKYINKYDGNLRHGGLLVKIYKNNIKNSYYCVLKQISGKTYNVSFKNNHMFYCDNKDNKLKDFLKNFISDIDNNKYNIIA